MNMNDALWAVEKFFGSEEAEMTERDQMQLLWNYSEKRLSLIAEMKELRLREKLHVAVKKSGWKKCWKRVCCVRWILLLMW